MFLQLLLGLATLAVGSFLSVRAAGQQAGQEPQELEDPTAQEGLEVPVVFGDVTVKSTNVIFSANKRRVVKRV